MAKKSLNYSIEASNEVVIELAGEDEDGNPKEIRMELEHGGSDLLEDSLVIEKTKTGYRIGYLAYDSDGDASNPEDCDGAGMIGTALRSDAGELHKRFQDALGLNSDWSKRVRGDDIMQEVAEIVFANRTDKDWRDVLRDPDPSWDHDTVREDLKLTYRRTWDKLVAQHEEWGDFGDPDRVMLSVYQHGGRIYQVGSGEGFVDRQWDVSEYGAVWVPDKVLRDDEAKGLVGKERQAKMEEWAGQLCKSMNDWLNGSIYGVVVQEHDAEGYLVHDGCDAVWGFIGSQYAEDELAANMRYAADHEREIA